MTTMRFIATTLIVMIAGLLNSCIMHDEIDDCPANKQLKVKATIETDSIGGGTIKWPEGSLIGITVFKAGTNECFGNNFGKKYHISNSSTGESDPDNDPIYLPDDGGTSDIIAYYPYSTPFDRAFIAPLSVADQSIPDSLDLITSNREGNIRPDAELIHLKFYRRLTKMVFNIKLISVAPDGTETIINEQLPGTRLNIEGLPVDGSYFLPDNRLTTGTSMQTISSVINKEGTIAAAIVFPRIAGEGVSFIVTLPDGSKHTKLLSPEQALQAGTENRFDVVIKRSEPVDPKPEYKITYELRGGLTPDNIAVKQGNNNAPWGINETIVVKEGSNFSFLYTSTHAVTARLADGTVLNTQNNTSYPFTNIKKDIHIILSKTENPDPPVDPEYKVTYELQGDLTMSNIRVSQNSTAWSPGQVITVKKGAGFSFFFNSDLIVRAILSDGTALNMSNNIPYSFTNISKDIHIILSANEPPIPPNPVYYKVTYELMDLSKGEITVTQGPAPNGKPWDEDKIITVQRGSTFTFTYTNISNKKVKTVIINDKVIEDTQSGRSYDITNINSDQHIVLGGETSHVVTLMINVMGGEFKSSTIVSNDGSYKFKMPSLKPGEAILVKIDGEVTTEYPDPDQYYTIENITKDKAILITTKKASDPDAVIKADVHKWENFKTTDGGIILPTPNK